MGGKISTTVLISLVGLLFAGLSAVAALLMVPEVRHFLGFDEPPKTEKQAEKPPPEGTVRTPWLGAEIWQGDNQRDIQVSGAFDRRSTVQMSPEPFELRFPLGTKKNGVWICAWTNDSSFSIDVGQRVGRTPCLGAGRGLAGTEFQTELYLAKNAFNCFCGNKRMTTEDGRDIVYISAIDGVPLAKTKQGTTLYLVMYHKKTENGVIDTQEFEYLILKF